MHPRRAAWLGKELSSSFPLFQQGTLVQAVGTQNQGFVSSFGGLRVVLDAGITTTSGSGTNEDVIYILRVADMVLFESPLQEIVFDAPLSGTLTVRLQIYGYSAFVSGRYPTSITILSGTGLATPSW
jgi:hypothetical protein